MMPPSLIRKKKESKIDGCRNFSVHLLLTCNGGTLSAYISNESRKGWELPPKDKVEKRGSYLEVSKLRALSFDIPTIS